MTILKLFASTAILATLAADAGCGSPADPAEHTPDAAVIEEPAKLAISASAARVPILQGATAELDVAVTRLDGASGSVTIAPAGLPAGVTAKPLAIGAGETTGTLVLEADAAAPHSLPTEVALEATLEGLVGPPVTVTVTITVYGPPGSLDTSFVGGRVMLPAGASDDYGHAVAVQADGKIVIAGRASEHLGDFALLRLDRDGNLDSSFGSGGRVLTDFSGKTDYVNALAIQGDGKIVAVGVSSVDGSGYDFAVARYLSDGSLDPSFGTGGKLTTAVGLEVDSANAVVIQSDGKLVVGGESYRGTQFGIDFALVRYHANGSLDTSFGDQGIVVTPIASNGARDTIYALALQTIDGEPRIVAAGGMGDFTLARYRANGNLDDTFGTGGTVANLFGSTIGTASAVAITPTGSIVAVGHSHNDVAIVQLGDDGQLDPLFGSGGKVVTPVNATNWDAAKAIAVDQLGKLAVAGWTYEGNSSSGNFVVLRYLTDGTLDPSFAGTGVVVTPVAAGTKADEAHAIALQADDRVPTMRIVVAGSASTTNSDFAVTRYWR